jgi:hypothetical protein
MDPILIPHDVVPACVLFAIVAIMRLTSALAGRKDLGPSAPFERHLRG